MTLTPRRRRHVRLTLAALAVAAVGVATPLAASSSVAASGQSGSHGSGGRVNDAGDEASELMESLDQFADARTAPTGLVAPGAYAAAYGSLSALPKSPAVWSSVTNKPYNSDDPNYRDPGASNSSGGAGYVTGRVEAVAVDNTCTFAGGGMSGVKRSCDGGTNWTPIADALPSQSIGSMEIAPDGALWVATGDGNTGSSTYVGAGVYRLASPDTGVFAAADRIGGTELDSQIIRRIRIDAANNRVFVAASRGLYAHPLGSTRRLVDTGPRSVRRRDAVLQRRGRELPRHRQRRRRPAQHRRPRSSWPTSPGAAARPTTASTSAPTAAATGRRSTRTARSTPRTSATPPCSTPRTARSCTSSWSRRSS